MKNTKAKLLGLLLVIAVVFSVLAVGVFAGEQVHVADSDALEAAVSNGTADYIVLDGDVTTDDVLVFNANDTIDLNGYTLTLGKGNNVVSANKNVTVINGTVSISGVNANTDGSVESGYENIFNLSAAGANLTLKDMTLGGQDFYSEYGVFYFGASTSSTLIVDHSEFYLSNDTSARGGVFKASNTAATVIIKNGSDINVKDVKRGFTYVTTRIIDSTVTITGTDATFEHGINACKEVSISNSVVSISGGSGRGITLGKGAITYLQITDSSKVSITDMAEATISVQSANNILIVEHNSFLVMDENVSFTKDEYNTEDFLRAVDGSHVLIGALTQGFVTSGSTGTHVYNELKVTDIKGHSDVAADVYFELYSDGKHIATSKYIKKAYTVGNLMSVFFEITTDSDSWVTEWHTYVPEWNGQSGATWDLVPDKAIAYFNGVACAVYEGTDNGKYPVNKKFGTWENVPGVIANADAMMIEDGVPVYYATVAEALAKVDSDRIVNAEIYILRDATLPYTARQTFGDDVTETITFIGDNYQSGAKVTLTLDQVDYWWAGIDMVNNDGVISYENLDVVNTLSTNYVAEITAKQGNVGYATTLADAIDYAQNGDTIKLLQNVIITEGFDIDDADVLADLTIDGNYKVITADFADVNDSLFYLGVPGSVSANGVTIKDLSINGRGKYAIYCVGIGEAMLNLYNVNVNGDWVYDLVLRDMLGANVTLSSFDKVFTNGSDNNALNLDSTQIGELYANESLDATDMFKVQVNDTADYNWATKIGTIYVWGGNTKTIAPATLAYADKVLDADTLSKMYVADERGVLYSTLQGAVDYQAEIADEADRVLTLLDSIVIPATVKIDLGLTLDLAGWDVTAKFDAIAIAVDTIESVTIANGSIMTTKSVAIFAENVADLAIVDAQVIAEGVALGVKAAASVYLEKVALNSQSAGALLVDATEALTLENCGLTAAARGLEAINVVAISIADTNISAGDTAVLVTACDELTVTNTDCASTSFAFAVMGSGVVTLEDVELTATHAQAIVVAAADELNVTDATLTSEQGDAIYAEEVAVNLDNVTVDAANGVAIELINADITVANSTVTAGADAFVANNSNIVVDNSIVAADAVAFALDIVAIEVVDTTVTAGEDAFVASASDLDVVNSIVNAVDVAFVLVVDSVANVDAATVVDAGIVVDLNNSANSIAFNGSSVNQNVLVNFLQGESWFTTTNKAVKTRLEIYDYEVAKLDPKTYYVVANLTGKVAYYYNADGFKTYVAELNATVYDDANGAAIVVIHTDALADFVSTIRNYGKTVYIDLNAYTLDISANLMLNGNGDVTIANGYITGDKNIFVYASKFTIGENAFVDVKIGNGWANSVITIAEGATVNSTIMTQGTVDVYGNLNNFTPNTDTSVLNTYEGSFVYGTIDVSKGVTNLMGGEIANVVVTGGTLNVKGGLVNNISVESDACVYVNGGWINKLMVKAYFATVEINGGIIDYLRVLSKFADVVVTGGLFGDNVTEYCANEICAVYNIDLDYFEIVELPAVRYYGDSMTLGTNLALNFYFTMDSFVDDNYFAVAIIKHEDSCDAENVYVLIPMTEWVERGELYGIVVDNIAAKDMICEVEIKLFRGDLPEYVDTLEEYNEITACAVATYTATNPNGADVVDSLELLAMDQIAYAVENGDDAAATMYSDLLHYGAAAQKYFGHNVNHFADHLLVDYPEYDKASATIDASKLASEYKYSDNVRVSLSLESTISMNVYVLVAEGFDVSTLVANVEYVNYLGETVAYTITAEDMVVSGRYVEVEGVTYEMIGIAIDTLSPADGLATIKCDVTGENGFVAYYYDSIAAYAYYNADASANTVLAELYEKIAKFAISANNYFED